MIINKVTFTGADDKTDIQKMRYLSTIYPCDLVVEYGILFSAKQAGWPRYPSQKWIRDLIFYSEELNLAAHFCGKYAKELIDGDDIHLKEIVPYFSRIQINYNFTTNPINFREPLMELISKYWHSHRTQFIFQIHEGNKEVCEKLIQDISKKYGWPTVNYGLEFLYDSSGGHGTEIKTFESSFKSLSTGYAGGLSPDNIRSVYNSLYDIRDEVVPGCWVDMESSLRNQDNEFDLEICKKVLYNLRNRF